MSLQVFNYLTREKELFEPLQEGRVGMYVCGPTVYDHAHLGHAKLYVAMDVVLRYLRYLGYTVRYVQNITDVGHLLDTGEDRIVRGAQRERVEPMELVETYTRSYFEDMDALGVTRPDISPRASGHILEQIEVVTLDVLAGAPTRLDLKRREHERSKSGQEGMVGPPSPDDVDPSTRDWVLANHFKPKALTHVIDDGDGLFTDLTRIKPSAHNSSVRWPLTS